MSCAVSARPARRCPTPATPPAPPHLSRHKFYRSLLQCAEALCSPATSALLGWHSAGSSRTIATALASLETQARRMGRHMGSDLMHRRHLSPHLLLLCLPHKSTHPLPHPAQVSHFVRVCTQAAAARSAPGGAGPSSSAAAGPSVESAEDRAEMDLAQRLLAVAAKVSAAAPAPPSTRGRGAAAEAAGSGACGSGRGGAGRGEEQSAEEVYRLTLSQYRVRILPGVSANHS